MALTDFASLASRGLAYWRLIEAFTPQDLPKTKHKGFPRVSNWPFADAGPWHRDSSFTRSNKKPGSDPFQHTIFAGLYQISHLLMALDRYFQGDKTIFQDRNDSKSAICKFVIDDSGAPVPGSFVLASAAWSTGLLLRKDNPTLVWKADWADQFSTAHVLYKEGFDNWVGEWHDMRRNTLSRSGGSAAQVASISRAEIDEFLNKLVAELGCQHLIAPSDEQNLKFEYRISSSKVPKSSYSSSDDLFMNSFFLNDLGIVRSACGNNDVGAALRAYLSSDSTQKTSRCDVRDPRALPQLLEILAPDRFPTGAWPAKGNHHLVFSQQVAVNEVSRGLIGKSGLFAVNGPPGTGKTTLLRDVIAMVIVERAKLIAKGVPFFVGKPRQVWETQNGRFAANVAPVHKDFHGFEIVVASSNNGAVENITAEIPGLEAVDPSWLDSTDNPGYFAELASAILTASRSGESGGEEDMAPAQTWAMLAAPLGNSNNRSKFLWEFWLKRKSSTNDASADARSLNPPANAPMTFRDILGAPEQFPTFKEALRRFREACDVESQVRTKISAVYAARLDIPAAEAAVYEATKDVTAAQCELQDAAEGRHPKYGELSDAVEDALQVLEDARSGRDVAQARYDEAARQADESAAITAAAASDLENHRREKPGFFENLITLWAAGSEWQAAIRELSAANATARIECDRDEKTAARMRDVLGQATSTFAACNNHVRKLSKERDRLLAVLKQRVRDRTDNFAERQKVLTDYRSAVECFQKNYSALYPDSVLLVQDEAEREKSSLWLTDEWYEARCRVFLAAIGLHKAYIGAHADEFNNNLSAMVDVLKSNVPVKAEVAIAVADAWRSLFFVLPVLSTTFASFDRLFAHLGSEAIGWLMIDEAGQATPQAAVGALWRSRRAVVVGDPMQLEPIVAAPYPFQKAVQRQPEFDLDDTWIPGKTSVQMRADAAMTLGTLLPRSRDNPELLWVGAPLRVHRRCDNPMFRVSNAIAYSNMMVFGKAIPDFPYSVAGISTGWIDIPFPTNGSTSNCNPAELLMVQQVLQMLRSSGAVDLAKDVFLLAPFRDTADELPKIGKQFGIDIKRTGTIHTAQGKEADIVILVLGGSSYKARKWAANMPNLLNVAVTRAKRIMVVIGSRGNWKSLEYFNTANDELSSLNIPVSPID